ncbi:TauD/TfdA family dioxygenase [Pseudomonas chlororaphis]|uniref:TauD/TfdA family dioxygenase n=1 Tax=Pseudomonas chlororaphis TaxID=587753 RepID=UPI0015DE62DC|nr:TauD/TfdA family dioxygenase [Pseudomonas chlororaphis]QLL12565.1 TauD/TfdA family dioxygenase [Pseudomonas chlororaphis subsp. aurantiaca]
MDPRTDLARHYQQMLGSTQVQCSFLPTGRMPLVITPLDSTLRDDRAAFASWYERHRSVFDTLLLEFGSLLFRGFALRDTADFQRIAQCYPEHAFGYIGGATPRKNIEGKVYESTRMPPSLKIGLHQEKAYMANYPLKLAFFCRQPSPQGGETVLCDMRAVTRRLPVSLLERFSEARIRYVRNFRAPTTPQNEPRNSLMREYHRPWDEVFLTQDPLQVEQLCRDNQLEYTWLEDGSITVSHTGAAVLAHPVTGEAIWFNQMSTQHNNARSLGKLGYEYIRRAFEDKPARPYEVQLGDGTPIATRELEPVYDALEAHEVAFAWSRGDLLLIDNIAVAHGRNPFTGTRDVQVALFD